MRLTGYENSEATRIDSGAVAKRHRRSRSWGAAAAAALAAAGLLASAGTVSTTGVKVLHVVAQGGAPGGSCSVTQPCSLAGALHAGQLTTSSTIMIPAGTYVGTLVINGSVSLQGVGQGQTILEGTASAPAVVVDSGAVSLADLTVTGGTGVGESRGAGGIDNLATLSLANVSVTGNTAVGDVVGAGGIYNSAGATLTMSGGSVTSNTSKDSDTCAGGIANDGSMTITGVTVSANTCDGRFVNAAGGIINGADGLAYRITGRNANLALSDATISANSDAPTGTDCVGTGTLGGSDGYCFVAAGGLIANGPTTVSGSTFAKNTAVTAGGAIFATSASSLNVTGSTFNGNDGGLAGGAISVTDLSGPFFSFSTSVSDSTFVADSASEGGAIYLGTVNSPSLSVVASTFVSDTATTGGAIAVDEQPSGAATLSLGADLFANTGCYIGSNATLSDSGYNVGTDGSCFAATPAASDVASPLAADLTALGNFGGQTQTVEPTAGNPATSAVPATGTPAFTQANGTSFTLCPTTDQRGIASSGACDAGAVQGVYAPPSAGPTTVPPTTVPTTTSPPPVVSPSSYLVAGADGTITTFNGAATSASIVGPGVGLAAPIVGVAEAPRGGHWFVGADGGVFAVGGAPFDGSLPEYGVHPPAPIVGIAAAPGGGYWLAAANGSVYTVNAASTPAYEVSNAINVSAPITGIAAAPGGGYWLVGADGGVLAFGGAPFEGSLPKVGTHVSDITAISA